MTDDSNELRVGTAEKESVAQQLGSAMADGQLTMAEYEDRVGRVWTSSTRSDLAKLTADLPTPVVVADMSQTIQRRVVPEEWKAWTGVAVLLIGIWGITSIAAGELIFFWPIFPLGIWGLVLVASNFLGDGNGDRSIE